MDGLRGKDAQEEGDVGCGRAFFRAYALKNKIRMIRENLRSLTYCFVSIIIENWEMSGLPAKR